MRRKRKRRSNPLPGAVDPKWAPALPPGPSPDEIKRLEEERAFDEESRRLRAEADAQIAKERADKEAKMKALDESIRLAQTELTLLEKCLFDAQHSFERAQVDLTWHHDETCYVIAKESADVLHDTRMLIVARVVEHNRLVGERNAMGMSKWQNWIVLGLIGLMGAAVYWTMLTKDKKP